VPVIRTLANLLKRGGFILLKRNVSSQGVQRAKHALFINICQSYNDCNRHRSKARGIKRAFLACP